MERIVVAMSGGVDSSVAAALVARQGGGGVFGGDRGRDYEAVGVTLKVLPRLDTGFGCCGSPRDIEDARRVCEALGIAHYVVDVSGLFERSVVDPFVQGYLRSTTPNPCVECNRSVKFGHLLKLAEAWNARFIATGHYARAEGGRLFAAADARKDQSYFLYRLTRRELERVKFPLGRLAKPEVRELARELGLATAEKPESQEICFVPRRDYRSFVRSRPGAAAGPSGPIRDRSGRLLGAHGGLEKYTVGQRRGLGLGSCGRETEPVYVTGMDPGSNTLFVGPDRETYRSGLVAGGVSWTGEAPGACAVSARIRHRHAPAPARLTPLPGGRVRVDFDEPQRAVTPGQAAVFYRGDEVLGGGTIEGAL